MRYYISVFKNYAKFTGRATRSEYWYFTLFHSIIIIVLSSLSRSIQLFAIIYMLYTLVALIPTIAVTARRMHDTGNSGWFQLIPIYNLVLACTKSEEGPNEYGPHPDNPEGMNIDEFGSEQRDTNFE